MDIDLTLTVLVGTFRPREGPSLCLPCPHPCCRLKRNTTSCVGTGVGVEEGGGGGGCRSDVGERDDTHTKRERETMIVHQRG